MNVSKLRSLLPSLLAFFLILIVWPAMAADNTPPTLDSVDPPQGANVISLTSVSVVFSEGVINVDAGDLLVDGIPATSVVTNDPNDYTFYFTQPPTGTVQVAFAPGHGITDLSSAANPFAGGNWTYTLDPNVTTHPDVVISEFMADNSNGIKDQDGQRNDWLELYNQGALTGNLDGWFLTDNPTNLTKWRLPGLVLRNNAYVIIWCSSKDLVDLNAPLHTNFKLQKEAGGYLALVDAQTNIISSFTNYPVQSADVSYGRDRVDPSLIGYFTTPTPGAQNAASGSGFMGPPVFSLASGIYTNVSLTLTILNTNAAGTIRYAMGGTLPTSTSTLYTGPIALTANSTIKARVFPPANTNLLPSDVGARNFIFLDGTAANFSSRLPTLIISTEGRSINADVPPGSPRTKGSFVVIDTVQGRSAIRAEPEVHELAEFEVFGQTSAGFPKRPIRVEIQDPLGNDLSKGLLGMPADADWRLRNPYDDKTLLNDFLGYEIWEKMGHYSVRRRMVEVFVDSNGGRTVYPGDYYGVMMLCETIKVKKDRVDVPTLSPYATNEPAITGGYIFARDKDSTGDLNFSSPGGSGFSPIPLKLHEPKPNDMRVAQGVTTSFPGAGYTPAGSNQMSYLRNFLGAMERAMYTNTWLTQTGTNHYTNYLDVERFADQMLHVEFTKQIDGYRLSDYFTKDRLGKVGPGPVWDWNLSFGNANYLQGGTTNGWYYELTGETDEPWARRLITGTTSASTSTGDPNFVQLIADRWAMFRTNVLNATNLLREIDEQSSLLSEAAARDLYGKYRSGLIGVYTWPNPDGGVATAGSSGGLDGRDVDYVRPTNYLGPIEITAPSSASGSIIGQMKKWVLGRYLWMDSQFTAVPVFSAADSMVANGFVVTVTPPAGATLYYTLDGTDPRISGGGVASGALSNNGPVNVTINSNTRIMARAKKSGAWKNTFSGANAVTLYSVVPSLRITEIMYHPAPPVPGTSTNSTEDFEYIEVKNIGNMPLNVNGFSLSGGVHFQFPNVTLTNGQTAVIVANPDAFRSRYGTDILILGTYTGNLNNAGDHVVLSGSVLEPILDFSYSDNWYPVTDGLGFSLVVVDENAATSAWNSAANWRPSAAPGGSPGQTDPPAPPRPSVFVNEVLAFEDPAAGDAIELYNGTGAEVDISGWFLSDDFATPRKYTIPPGTAISAGGYKVFYATNSFGATNEYTAFGTTAFGLGAKGDQVHLFSADGINLTGYSHGFDFGASSSNVTFGRYVISTGADHFVAQSANTLGSSNAGPLVGPVVVSEIQYHPADVSVGGISYNNVSDEFIELHNVSGNEVPLYDVAFPTNRWRLGDAVGYNFPASVTLPPGGYLLVVGFDPIADPAALASFRDRNLVPSVVPVLGPWSGALDNNAGRVELSRPGTPDTNGAVPYILVERISYSDSAPWPVGADGFGLTLQRIVATAYGNDPTNWAAGAPTPGAAYVSGGTAPTITSQPGNQLIIFGNDVTLTASATGTEPLRYQWRFNGVNIAGATNTTLMLPDLQPDQVGIYNIFVYNSGGYALGTNFTLSGRVGFQITSQPVDQIALVGQTVSFNVAAVGTGTLRYQWRKDGADLSGATDATLTLTGIQPPDDGIYTCLVADDYDSMVTDAAALTVAYKPVITLQPFSQSVVEGGTVSFSISATGTLALSFRWRSNGVTFIPASSPIPSGQVRIFENGTILNGPTNSSLILSNVGMNYNSARFSVVITNIVGAAPISSSATLTVLADSDHDGLPDVWEEGRPGFDPNDPSDGARDDDGDGMSNAAEYFAGTDPFDASSYLRVDIAPAGIATLSFNAVSNRTYTVQYTDGLHPASWNKLADVLARAVTRTEVLTDPGPATNRFYRLVIPAQP